MSCIAVSARSSKADGATFRNDAPSGPSTTSTPSVVSSRYGVVSSPMGSMST